MFPLFHWSSVPTVPLVLCTHCSTGPLYPLFLWSSVPTAPLVLCTHCSTSPLLPLCHWSTVPTVPLVLYAHCSLILCSYFCTVLLILCALCFSAPLCPLFTDPLYPLTLPFCYTYLLIISYFRTRYMRDYPPLITLGSFEGNTHSTSRCKHAEQCHIWGDKTRATYMFAWLCINKRNHL